MQFLIKANFKLSYLLFLWLLFFGAICSTSAQAVSYPLVVNKTGDGAVNSSDNSIICGGVCNANYVSGTKVTLTAAANTSTSTFAGWTGACSGLNSSCTVSMTAAKTVYALFTARDPAYTRALSVGKSGSGIITSDYAGINCGGDCSEAYNMGAVINLTATPSLSYFFEGWSGACQGAGTNPVCPVSLTQNQTAYATFKAIPNAAGLQVYKAGAGTVTGPGIICGSDCNEVLPLNGNVILTATPAAGYSFQGWSGACTGTGDCSVSMDATKYVYALFQSKTATTYHLTMGKLGDGNVKSNWAGIDCGSDCGEYYETGRVITLTAKANPGSVFAKWTGVNNCATAVCNVTMNSYQLINATFSIPPAAPVLNAPANGAMQFSQPTITFSWQSVPNATRYQLYLYHYSTEEVMTFTYTANQVGCPAVGPLCTVVLPPNLIFPDGKLQWGVKAGNDYGAFGAGTYWSLYLKANPTNVLITPNTISPPAGITVSMNYPTMYSWVDTGAPYYHVIVTDSMGKRVDAVKERTNVCNSGMCSFSFPVFLTEGPASWQVRSWSPVDTSNWSTLINFTVAP